jgi:hypothetical protein
MRRVDRFGCPLTSSGKLLLFSRRLSDEIHFCLPVERSVRAQHLVKHTAAGREYKGVARTPKDNRFCVLPATNPQLLAPTRSWLAMGKIPSNVLPTERAMDLEQTTGRWNLLSHAISAWKDSGQL